MLVVSSYVASGGHCGGIGVIVGINVPVGLGVAVGPELIKGGVGVAALHPHAVLYVPSLQTTLLVLYSHALIPPCVVQHPGSFTAYVCMGNTKKNEKMRNVGFLIDIIHMYNMPNLK